jgi:hypothetical protein
MISGANHAGGCRATPQGRVLNWTLVMVGAGRSGWYNPGMEAETQADDITYEPIPESEFERAIEALRAVLAFAEEIRRGAPALVIE